MNASHNLILYIGFILAVISMALFSFNRKKPAILLLAAAAFFIRLHMAHLDAFLHDWDEKYHALVARNMMDNPFMPVLKNGLSIPFDYKAWCCNHIWVHKQPLFMWQMALSMKIFGVSEYAIRYPDVLMGALMVLMVYRIGKLFTGNEAVGFVAALFMCFSNYQLELTAGYHGMDHNDLTFGFYVLASLWAYAEYIKKGGWKWALLVGVFAGCAILNKWLTGLLVFAAWGINLLTHIRNPDTRKEILHITGAVFVCVLVFLPWQLYILNAFPKEAAYEFSYNSKHVFEVVEGHKGTEWYYWGNFPMYFGKYSWVLLLMGILLPFFIKEYRTPYGMALATMLLTVFIFFSFIVQSKLQSYFFVVAPMAFIIMALALVEITVTLKLPPLVAVFIGFCLCYSLYDREGIYKKHNPDDGYRITKAHNTSIFKELSTELPKDIDVVSNLSTFQDVEFMFYNKGVTAYHYNPTVQEFAILKRQGLKMAAFKDHADFWVPDHMLVGKEVFIIRKQLK